MSLDDVFPGWSATADATDAEWNARVKRPQSAEDYDADALETLGKRQSAERAQEARRAQQ